MRYMRDDFSRHFTYAVSKCLNVQNVARLSQTLVRDIIVRYREMRISGTNGLPLS